MNEENLNKLGAEQRGWVQNLTKNAFDREFFRMLVRKGLISEDEVRQISDKLKAVPPEFFAKMALTDDQEFIETVYLAYLEEVDLVAASLK